jgi:hypothetical protein
MEFPLKVSKDLTPKSFKNSVVRTASLENKIEDWPQTTIRCLGPAM